MNSNPKPTNSELEILSVLWRNGPSTVKQVHQELAVRGTGYTTILKLMQIMAEKGLVSRQEEGRAHIYEAAYAQEAAQKNLLGELVEKVFGGSSQALVLRALENQPASKQELEQIRALIDKLEGTKRD